MAFNPKEVAKKLNEVGEHQIATGQKLEQSAAAFRKVAVALKDNERIDQSLGAIESGTRSTRNLLMPISAGLRLIASSIDRISIPTVDFNTRKIDIPVVGRIKVVTKISVASTRPFRDIASSINSVADDLDNIGNGLKAIADGVGDLQNELPNVSNFILNGADEMEQSGNNLVETGQAMQAAGALFIG